MRDFSDITPRKGDVYWIYDKTKNIKHMYLVISDEEILKLTKYVWVFYLTSKKKYKNRDFCVTIPKGTLLKCQTKESYIDCTKIKSISIDYFKDENFCGHLPDNIMGEIDNTIFDVLNLGKYFNYWPINK